MSMIFKKGRINMEFVKDKNGITIFLTGEINAQWCYVKI